MAVTRIGVLLFSAAWLIGMTTRGYALAICVDSKEVTMSQSECVRKGAEIMGRYFGQVQHDNGAVFGFQGKDDAAAILCDRVDAGSVFFSVASTDASVCGLNILKLKNGF